MVVVGLVLLNFNISSDSQSQSSEIILTYQLLDSQIIDQILEENLIGYGFVQFLDDKSSNGILTNIHIENGKIIDTWHNELIQTNYDGSGSFCINSQEIIGITKVENNQIVSIFDSNIIDSSKLSENFLTVKLVSDLDCYYHIKAIVE